MPGFLTKLFGKPVPPKPREPSAEDERVGLALMVAIEKQLNALGVQFQQAPKSGPFVTPDARGTLIGAAFGVLQGEGIELTQDRIIDTVIAAFVFTYGDPIGRDLAAETFDAFQAQDPTILRTSEWARQDMLGVYQSGGNTSFAAYMLAVQGMI